jgi:hypothetical protein
MAKLRNYSILLLILLVSCSNFGWQLIERQAQNCHKTGSLSTILSDFPDAQYALLIAEDGLGIVVSQQDFAKIEIEKNNSWQVKANQFPPSANLRNLEKICLYSNNFITIYRKNRKYQLSPFQIYLQNMNIRGVVSQNGNFIRKYRLRDEINLVADSIFINKQKITLANMRKRIGLEK